MQIDLKNDIIIIMVKSMKNRKIRIITLGSLSFMCIFYCIFTAITYPKKIKSLTATQDKLNNSLTELKEEGWKLKMKTIIS